MKNLFRRLLVPTVKFLLIFGIFAFLFWRTSKSDAFEQLLQRDKNWSALGLTFVYFFTALLLTFFRWQFLVRALNVPITVSETLKLGFLGQIFNYLPVGIIGGDVVKGYLLSRGKPGTGTKIAASVIMDRVIGLYVMFLIGFIALWTSGLIVHPAKEAQVFVRTVIILFSVFTVGLSILLWPESKSGIRHKMAVKVPFAGPLFGKLLEAVEIYRSQWRVLLISFLMTFGVHVSFALGIYCIARGLFELAPSAWDHLAIYPIGNTASLIPLSVGPLEAFLDMLYPLFDIVGGEPYKAGYGMLIGIGYRVISMLIAGIGGIYYIFGRSELKESLKEMKSNKQDENSIQENDCAKSNEVKDDK